MLYINNNPFSSDSLYFVFDFLGPIIDTKIAEHEQSLLEVIEDNCPEQVLLHDPSIKELKNVVKYFGKKIVISLSFVWYDILELLRSDLVDLVFIYDSLDEIFLKQNNITKYKLCNPVSVPKHLLKLEKKNEAICLNSLKSLTDKSINSLVKLSSCLRLNFSGLKIVSNKRQFDKIMKIMYTSINLISYPSYNLKETIASYKYLFYFTDDGKFPIEAFFAASTGVIPFIFSKNRFYKWLPGYLHVNDTNQVIDIIKNKSNKDILEDINCKLELFNSEDLRLR